MFSLVYNNEQSDRRQKKLQTVQAQKREEKKRQQQHAQTHINMRSAHIYIGKNMLIYIQTHNTDIDSCKCDHQNRQRKTNRYESRKQKIQNRTEGQTV